MIRFIENSEMRLKFVSYPITSSITYLIILLLFIPLLYWCLYLSPIESSITCQKSFLNRIDCRLEEKSILNPYLTKLDIKNVKKIVTHSFGDRDSRIKLKANPNPPYIDKNRFQKTYFYPSNPFSLVFLHNFHPLNWFIDLDRSSQLDDFVRGRLHQQSLSLKQTIKGFDFLFIGLFVGTFLLFILSIILYFFTAPIVSIYEINLENHTLIIWCKRLLLKNIKRQYKLDIIKQIKLDEKYKVNFNTGRIILELDPDYDYPIDEFSNVKVGKANFQVIKKFLEKNK